MTLQSVTLNDKYTLETGRVFLTGIQALVRLTMMQRRRDLAAGLNTGGFVSGYRGSPLGGLDQQFAAVRGLLEEHHVQFKPGVNEDLAATAAWGSQQAELEGQGKYDGVFGMWYGKGPGVDRSGDALRHSNLAGTSPNGGVLALLGDDHTCESSTTAHQSEYAMVDAMIPVLNPAGVQEILDYGLYGYALSRYSGCWVALKCMHDTVEAAASVYVDPSRVSPVLPDDYEMPPGGLNIRWPDTPQAQELRLHEHKLDAVRAFCRANALDKTMLDSSNARLGIVTTGKSYLDVRQALDDLGIHEASAERLGVRLYKVAMSWPLEPSGIVRFSEGLEQIIVVEEKRGLIESQLKDHLYGRAHAPSVVGKHDEAGKILFPSAGRLESNHIALNIGRRLLALGDDESLNERVAAVDALVSQEEQAEPAMIRTPYFCAGCPHNTSTRVPEGSHALAGIGCHYMAQWMDRGTARYTQMGAEGASWVGEAPFSKREHVFQNIGDGTYFHSGLLAVRAAAASEANITFKILYNDAVAMTGGQSVDGQLSVPQVTRQVHAEGAKRVVVVTDEPEKYPRHAGFAPGVTVHHRDELDAVQRELREVPGMTVLVYDQTCAAEKRRRRKRGRFPDPPKRILINEAVCEGCGDCGVQSNCVALVPVETEFGRKRAVDQSACNKDYSCVKGFCPSFVTVHGGNLKKGSGAVMESVPEPLPEPSRPSLETPYGIVVTGVGGTGVITIGALLGMAAHLEGKGCSVLDMTGLAQKGGAVVSHIRIAETPEAITTTRIAAGGAGVLLGCDLVVTASRDALRSVRNGVTRVVVNRQENMTGDFTRDADLKFPGDRLVAEIGAAAGGSSVDFVDATRTATALLGDAIASNLFMLGVAFQNGYVPLSAAAIEGAIELNGVAVEMNKKAFAWGRRWVAEPARLQKLLTPRAPPPESQDLQTRMARRVAFLTDYQDVAYAGRYRALVERVRSVEAERVKGREALTEAVANHYFRLLSYKDEYEVARLYTNGAFDAQLRSQFEGDFQLEFHLAPPLISRRDAVTGELRKRRFGPWVMRAFRALAGLKHLRGGRFDVFGYTAERRMERDLIADYERTVDELLPRLDSANHATAVEIASIPEQIRGFGHVKERNRKQAKVREAELLSTFRSGDMPAAAA